MGSPYFTCCLATAAEGCSPLVLPRLVAGDIFANIGPSPVLELGCFLVTFLSVAIIKSTDISNLRKERRDYFGP